MSTEQPQDAGTATTEAGGQQTTEAAANAAGNQGTANAQTPPASQQAPAEIVYEFKAPEGVTLDQARVDEFTALAKDLKLPAEKAQALVDMATKVEVQRREEHQGLVAKWTEEIAQDKELGGDKLPQTLATAKKVFSLLPDAEAESFRQLLDLSGFGSHPSMVRMLHAVGNALSEDKFITGGKAPSGAEQATALRMFPNMNP